MKVLVVSHMYPSTFSEIGGIFIHQQVKELQKQGCEVRVISPIPMTPFPVGYISRKWKAYSQVPKRMTWEGIDVWYPRYLVFPKALFLASSGKRMYWGIKKLVDNLYKEFQFDIIHAHVAIPAGFAAMMLSARYKKPLVVTIHGADLQDTIHRNTGCKKALVRVFERSNKVVTVSGKLKEIANTNIGFPEKTVIVSNGIDSQDVAPEKGALASQYAGFRIVLSVSNLKEIKGIDINLRVISQLAKKYPNLKYIVIGDGPEMSSLQNLTRSLNLERQVEFTGQLPNKQVMEYMAIADIFSLPSWQEGFGVVYLEAAMHGKPVIACEGEGISDIFQNGKTGLFVKPRDVEDTIKAMDFLLENPEQAHEIGERAKRLVLENYTWGKNAQRNIQIYKELLIYEH